MSRPLKTSLPETSPTKIHLGVLVEVNLLTEFKRDLSDRGQTLTYVVSRLLDLFLHDPEVREKVLSPRRQP